MKKPQYSSADNPCEQCEVVIGRPRIEFDAWDWEQMQEMCFMLATKEEIARLLQVSEDTLENRIREKYDITFSAYHKKHSEGGKMSLRRAMFSNAIANENTTMQIWLSKQHLGMRDFREPITLDKDGEGTLNIYFGNKSAKDVPEKAEEK